MEKGLADTFSVRFPSHQESLDLFGDGWPSKVPAGTGLKAGPNETFTDARVPWAAEILGGLAGKTILELGPFEAYNTAHLESLGAASVISVEGSSYNFMKCLIIKNIFGLCATFLHGDFVEYLTKTNVRFDVCWASGVLYHQTRPAEFLNGIWRVSDAIFLWSHYYDAKIIAAHPDAETLFAWEPVVVPYDGVDLRLYRRDYAPKLAGGLYAGGAENFSYWMELDDIYRILRSHGFVEPRVGYHDANHVSGPAISLLATR